MRCIQRLEILSFIYHSRIHLIIHCCFFESDPTTECFFVKIKLWIIKLCANYDLSPFLSLTVYLDICQSFILSSRISSERKIGPSSRLINRRTFLFRPSPVSGIEISHGIDENSPLISSRRSCTRPRSP